MVESKNITLNKRNDTHLLQLNLTTPLQLLQNIQPSTPALFAPSPQGPWCWLTAERIVHVRYEMPTKCWQRESRGTKWPWWLGIPYAPCMAYLSTFVHMYGIFTYIYRKSKPNVDKYIMHGASIGVLLMVQESGRHQLIRISPFLSGFKHNRWWSPDFRTIKGG